MVKAEKADRKDRVIALISADSGCGKSFFMACLKNALIYDTDLGGGLLEYEDRIHKNGSERLEVSSYAEVLADLRQRLKENRLKENIVLDHVTTMHQNALLKHNPSQDADYGRGGNKATYEWRQVREFIRTFDCNLFCVSHLKNEFDRDKMVGKIADGAKNIEGDMHIYLRLESAKDDKGRKKYPSTAHVIKWRRDPADPRGLPPESFKFTLEEFEKIHGYNYLRERENIVLASAESIAKLQNVMSFMDKAVAQEMTEKWLKAAGVDAFEFMSQTQVDRCTEFVNNKIKGVK
jgi:hypothetical protein